MKRLVLHNGIQFNGDLRQYLGADAVRMCLLHTNVRVWVTYA